MYKCDLCNINTLPGESLNYFISKRRDKEYYIGILRHRRNGNKIILYKKPTNEEVTKWKGDNLELISEKVTRGWEIEKELKLCKECYGRNMIKLEEINKI